MELNATIRTAEGLNEAKMHFEGNYDTIKPSLSKFYCHQYISPISEPNKWHKFLMWHFVSDWLEEGAGNTKST